MSCVGTIYNVVPRPLLQTVLVIRHYCAVVGTGGGKARQKHCLGGGLFFVPSSRQGWSGRLAPNANKNIAVNFCLLGMEGGGLGREDSMWSCSLGG